MSAITIAQIAEEAGVSPMTVSIALRPQHGRSRISPETRERICALAKKMNYRPNPSAKNLALARSHHIGFYLNSPEALNLSTIPRRRIISTTQAQLWKRGYRLGIYYFESEREEGFSEFLTPRRFVDGIMTLGFTLSAAEIAKIRASGMPTISLYHKIKGMRSFTIDFDAMARHAAEYLHAHGHREIAILAAGTLQHERIFGFRQRAQELGLRVPDERIFLEPLDQGRTSEILARRLVGALMASRAPAAVTAFYIPSDYLAIEIVRFMEANGKVLGRDFSVISFDNLEGQGQRPWDELRLTSYDPPYAEIGEAVAATLGQPDARPEDACRTFKAHLVERRSVRRLSTD
ncbi:MAG TPA: LacI family DNA-binding transcriptional regulator [Chthoniobacteraceae bacterium]|nr:LacI family DNA-binding transcriptional regulator [Chthoniobacteraceae bacterium]